MNIMMFANTYAPFVGGVLRSVKSFIDDYEGGIITSWWLHFL